MGLPSIFCRFEAARICFSRHFGTSFAPTLPTNSSEVVAMYHNLLTTRWMLTFTATRGNSLSVLSDGGLNWGRRMLNQLVPAGSYDDDLPEPPLPTERPLRSPADVPVRDPFDVPVRSPADVPVRGPHDVPPPPSEPPFPLPPKPASPPEQRPEAWLDQWLDEQRQKRASRRTGRKNQGRRRSDR
jgi:hypothetical protein